MVRGNKGRVSRRSAIKAGIAGGLLGLSGCLGGGDGNGSGSGNGGGNGNGNDGDGNDGLTQINVAVPHFGLWNTSRLIIVDDEQGFFEEEGVDLNRIDTSGGGANVRTVMTGDADVLFENGIFGTFASYREGADVRIVSSMADPRSADLYWFAEAGSEYDSLENSDGASIGYSSPGSSTHMVAEGAIEYAGLDNAEAVSAGGPADNYSAVLTGEIDIGWSTPVEVLPGIEDGEVQQVFRGDEVQPFDNLSIRTEIANLDWLESDPDTAEAFFRAQQKCLEWEWENLDEAAALWAEVLEHDNPEALAEIIEVSYPGSDPGEISGIDESMDLAIEHDFIDSPLSEDELDELIDLSYLP